MGLCSSEVRYEVNGDFDCDTDADGFREMADPLVQLVCARVRRGGAHAR